MFKLTMYFMLWLSCIRLFSSKYFVCVLSVNIVLASTDGSLYSMCVCRCVAKRETRPHPLGRQTEAHIQCSLWKRAVPHCQIISISLRPSSLFLLLYIHLFLFSYVYSPLQHTLLYFIHLALHIFSQNLSGFHFELVPPLSPYMFTAFKLKLKLLPYGQNRRLDS